MLTTSGSEGWVSEFDQYFKHVADINVRDLEDAFLVHNNPHGMEHFEDVSLDTHRNIRCQLVTSLLVNMVMSTWLTIVVSLSY